MEDAVIPYNASLLAPVLGTVTVALAATCKPPVEVVPARWKAARSPTRRSRA